MTTTRQHFLMVSGVALTGFLLVLALQPYSVDSPWSRFNEPARRYLGAALRHDSVALQTMSASSRPIRWAIGVGRANPPALAAWARSARASFGFTRGDTTDVWYETPTAACPFRLSFLRDHGTRVVDAGARCYFQRGWPIDSAVIDIQH